MKRFGIASAALAAAALLLTQQAMAADYHPRKAKHARVYKAAKKTPAWTCNIHNNCTPTWGWGAEVGSTPWAAVVVARGPVPIESYYHPYYACKEPRPIWNGYRWVKVWEPHCGW
jgi:hypothetical protein